MTRRAILAAALGLLSALLHAQNWVYEHEEPAPVAQAWVDAALEYFGFPHKITVVIDRNLTSDDTCAQASTRRDGLYIAYDPACIGPPLPPVGRGYSGDFLATEKSWEAARVLCHEIGHHLLGHTRTYIDEDPVEQAQADEWSGWALHGLGANPAQALAGTAGYQKWGDKDYPGRDDRIKAIERGYASAEAFAQSYNRIGAQLRIENASLESRLRSRGEKATGYSRAYEDEKAENIKLIRELGNVNEKTVAVAELAEEAKDRASLWEGRFVKLAWACAALFTCGVIAVRISRKYGLAEGIAVVEDRLREKQQRQAEAAAAAAELTPERVRTTLHGCFGKYGDFDPLGRDLVREHFDIDKDTAPLSTADEIVAYFLWVFRSDEENAKKLGIATSELDRVREHFEYALAKERRHT